MGHVRMKPRPLAMFFYSRLRSSSDQFWALDRMEDFVIISNKKFCLNFKTLLWQMEHIVTFDFNCHVETTETKKNSNNRVTRTNSHKLLDYCFFPPFFYIKFKRTEIPSSIRYVYLYSSRTTLNFLFSFLFILSSSSSFNHQNYNNNIHKRQIYIFIMRVKLQTVNCVWTTTITTTKIFCFFKFNFSFLNLVSQKLQLNSLLASIEWVGENRKIPKEDRAKTKEIYF